MITKENKKLDEYINNCPNNEVICKDILKIIGNDTTKVILDKDIKNSYYVYLNDTIYISDNEQNSKKRSRVLLIAHECIHSMQSKVLQLLNFMLSNIELILFVVAVVLIYFNIFATIIFSIYLIIAVFSMIIRGILEIDAVNDSIGLAKKYLSNLLDENQINEVFQDYTESINKLYPLFIFQLYCSKIIRVLIVIILMFI